MYQYSSVNDPDRHSMSLVLSMIEARVMAVTTLPSGSFMDKDSPHPLRKNIVRGMVGFIFLVFFFLLPSLFFRFDAGFIGD